MNKRINHQASTSGKLIRSHDTSSKPSETKKPIFSFQYLNNDYCISRCTKEEKASLADKLRMLSTLTWAQIHQAHKHGLGCEKIEKNAIKKPIPSFIKPDAAILAFRFCGKHQWLDFERMKFFTLFGSTEILVYTIMASIYYKKGSIALPS